MVVWLCCWGGGVVVFLCLVWWCFCGGGVVVAPFFNSTPFWAPAQREDGPQGKGSLAQLALHPLSKWEVMGSILRGGLLLWRGGIFVLVWRRFCDGGAFVVVVWLCFCGGVIWWCFCAGVVLFL